MTRIWRFEDEPTSLQIAEIARALEGERGVLLLPTDTIYGLHARAADSSAVQRIADMKGRDDIKPVIVLASAIDDLRELGVTASEATFAALDAIWPAPLTVILPLTRPLPASRGAMTLAARIPALAWLRDLVARTGPLVSTSANRSGEPPIHSPADLARALHDSVDGIADSGVLMREPSAILDLTSTEPRFIREGDHSFTQNVWKTLRKTL